MPPDTTLTNLLFDPKTWLDHLDTILSIIGGGGLLGLLAKLKQWHDRRSLRKRLGATLYTPEDIERAMRYYLRPYCQSVDPAQSPEIRGVYASREDLFSAIDRLLDEDTEFKYLLLLADSGMGKTAFQLNYYARYLRRFRKPFQLQVIPLGIKDADARIKAVAAKSDTVLFLDALDEDTLAIVDHRQRVLDLCDLTREFRRVLITCRTQFFPRAEEEPGRTGVVKLGTIGPKETGEYFFHKLYLSPFDDAQVKKYLQLRYRFWRWRKRRQARQVAGKIPQLTVRPMLLALIDNFLASGRDFSYSFQLYEEAVEGWLDREVGRVEGLQKEPLREFCERLAIELFVQRQEKKEERLPYEAIEPLAQKFGIKLEGWKLTSRSLLNRDAEDNFKFAHRSIMEYLSVKRFLALPAAERPELSWTDQMKRFLWEMVQANMPKPLDLSKADLLGLVQLAGVPTRSFRREPYTLSSSQVQEMIKRYGFFDSSWNKSGRGVPHVYVPYVRDKETLVFDITTGLSWQQSGSPDQLIFEQAQDYVKELNAKKYAGFNDWRLPTLEEAMSLMERETKQGNLYIDPLFDRQQTWIWTADKESAGRAWSVNFVLGYCSRHGFGDVIYVRAVRS
ncbi:DUF1566 domain-containing protein [candidate division KSB1 bacterium]|nr:DUF1566 domain-containing protein [candidate division KSB1 bacterium]